MCRLQLTALVRNGRAVDHSQQLPLGDFLTQPGMHRSDDASHARDDVSGTVFIEANLSGQHHFLSNGCGTDGGKGHAHCLGLCFAELDEAFLLLMAMLVRHRLCGGRGSLVTFFDLLVVMLAIRMVVGFFVVIVLCTRLAMVLAVLVRIRIRVSRSRRGWRESRRTRGPQNEGTTHHAAGQNHGHRNPVFGRRDRRVKLTFIGHIQFQCLRCPLMKRSLPAYQGGG